jgi:hypothetical protein
VRSNANTQANGPTSDQIVANAIAGNTTVPALTYRAQASWYLSVSSAYGRDIMSYKMSAGSLVPVVPTVSPQAAFNALFGNFTPPVDPGTAKKADFDKRARISVLDRVADNIKLLMPKLGQADQRRLQQHYDEIRALENQIKAIPPPATSTCSKPADPGVDPAVGGSQGVDSSGSNTYSVNLGYSNEEQRAKVLCDLIHMAFTCDLSRVATLMISMFQSHMNMYTPIGVACDLHEIGHHGDPKNNSTLGVSKGIAWHVKHFAYLVAKLRDTPEGSGKLIDNTVALLLHEGGHGLDTGANKPNSSHSTENMACLIAGRAGGLKPGKHVVATGMHPANVLVSAMTAVGVPGNALGEVTGTIPALFT